MEQKTLAFAAGQVFESNTTYVGEKREYHIYPQNATGTINPWYSGGGAPVPVAFVLRGLENVTIDLGGAALIFHGRITPFFLMAAKTSPFGT